MSNWIIAIATVVLVVVTARYVALTSELLREQINQRKAALQPALTCTLSYRTDETLPGYGSTLINAGQLTDLSVSNVGNSPALETTVAVLPLNQNTAVMRVEAQSLPPWTIAIGATWGTRLSEIQLFPFANEMPKVRVIATYKNAFDLTFMTAAEFAFPDVDRSKVGKPGVTEWTKTAESIRQEP